jgi:hypothetical protein
VSCRRSDDYVRYQSCFDVPDDLCDWCADHDADVLQGLTAIVLNYIWHEDETEWTTFVDFSKHHEIPHDSRHVTWCLPEGSRGVYRMLHYDLRWVCKLGLLPLR